MATGRESTGLIAQLSRSQRRKSHIAQPSPHAPGHFDEDSSTFDSFLPEHESTQQIDITRNDNSLTNDKILNEDQHTMMSDTQSIEIGRGLKTQSRKTSHKQILEDQTEDSIIPLNIDDSQYNFTASPQGIIMRKTNDLRKQAALRRAAGDFDTENIKVKGDIVPIKTRQAGLRSLSDMHARVNAISDSSFIQPDLEKNKHTNRNSRFTSIRPASAIYDPPTRFTSGTGLQRAVEQTPKRSVSLNEVSLVGNQTAQSFMLPDLPNIAELVSGVRKDGTPVFSRTAKSKSRFTSALYGKGGNQTIPEHANIRTVALPDEEKAIFTSLQLLKEKVATLEMEKIDAVKRADENEDEVVALKSQIQMERRLRQSDSRGIVDEQRQPASQWRIDEARLQAELNTAQNKLEQYSNKTWVSDVASKRIIQERDSLITQLGVAFYSNEEMKEENMQLQKYIDGLENNLSTMHEEVLSLREQAQELVLQVEQSERQHNEDLRQWAIREKDLKARAAKKSTKGLENPLVEKQTKEDNTSNNHSKKNILERVEVEVRKARAEAVRQSKKVKDKASRSRSRPRQDILKDNNINMSVESVNGNAQIDGDEGDNLNEIAMAIKSVSNLPDQDTQNITHLSFLDPAELAALRKRLEQERLMTKQRRSASEPLTENAVVRTNQEDNNNRRKSSMRDIPNTINKESALTRNVRVQSPETEDHISYSEPNGIDSIDKSLVSEVPTRYQSKEGKTSAFIHFPNTIPHPSTTKNDVDKGPLASIESTSSRHNPPESLRIPSPAIFSKEGDVDTTSATIRPSQEPRQALKTVLEGLQDEIAGLKLKLDETEKEYSEHDPTVGKKKREGLRIEMEALIRQIEYRSEQVYGLFDVLAA